VDVADFLQLQGAFQRNGIVIPAAEEQPVLALAEVARDVADLLVLLQHQLDLLRNRAQAVDQLLVLALAHEPPPADVQGEHRQRHALAGEGFG
jgi:hypothetical protein